MREAIYAGSFYAKNKEVLLKELEILFSNTKTKLEANLKGLICPHAGYIYSGKTAAFAYNKIVAKNYDLVIILAPSHRASQDIISISSENYQSPLGEVITESIMAQKLSQVHPKIILDQKIHRLEHSLEVQLPFLQYIFGKDLKILPIIISGSIENAYILKSALIQTINFAKTLIIASSDLSHYHNYQIAQKMDLALIDAIKNFEIKEIVENISNGTFEACGILPIMSLMLMMQELNFIKTKLLNYETSAKINNDFANVVGYASLAFY